jgi:hypothetical protein
MLLKEFHVQERASFLDYVFGGCDIGVHIAIDYTLSNGKAADERSLHYLKPGVMINEYTAAI